MKASQLIFELTRQTLLNGDGKVFAEFGGDIRVISSLYVDSVGDIILKD